MNSTSAGPSPPSMRRRRAISAPHIDPLVWKPRRPRGCGHGRWSSATCRRRSRPPRPGGSSRPVQRPAATAPRRGDWRRPPSAAMSKAVICPGKGLDDDQGLAVRRVITVPFGNISSSAASCTDPSGSTRAIFAGFHLAARIERKAEIAHIRAALGVDDHVVGVERADRGQIGVVNQLTVSRPCAAACCGPSTRSAIARRAAPAPDRTPAPGVAAMVSRTPSGVTATTPHAHACRRTRAARPGQRGPSPKPRPPSTVRRVPGGRTFSVRAPPRFRQTRAPDAVSRSAVPPSLRRARRG